MSTCRFGGRRSRPSSSSIARPVWFCTRAARATRVNGALVTSTPRRYISAMRSTDPSVLQIAFLRDGAFVLPSDRRQPYRILLEVDTFIFEFRSMYENLGKFLVLFFDRILGRGITQAAIKSELAERGVDMRWAAELDQHRKVFFHQQAPWLAVRVKSWDVFDAELLILSTLPCWTPARRCLCLGG